MNLRQRIEDLARTEMTCERCGITRSNVRFHDNDDLTDFWAMCLECAKDPR